MNIEEKIKLMKDNKEKNYCFLSPFFIQKEATIGDTKDTIDLYINMEDNTKKFADNIITDFIIDAAELGIGKDSSINLKLAYAGDWNDYPDNISEFPDFIIKNKDKIVAIYKYVNSVRTEDYFFLYPRTYSSNNYAYLYFNLGTLLTLFDQNNIDYEIATTIDRSIPSLQRNDEYTQFILHYNPLKEIDNQPQKTYIKKDE